MTSRQQPNRQKPALTRKSSVMISREDALKSLETLSKDESLPQVLQENKIKAEPLLFKEA